MALADDPFGELLRYVGTTPVEQLTPTAIASKALAFYGDIDPTVGHEIRHIASLMTHRGDEEKARLVCESLAFAR